MDVSVLAERDDDGRRYIDVTARVGASTVTRGASVDPGPVTDSMLDEIACQIACGFTALDVRPPSTWVVVRTREAALREYGERVLARHAEYVAAIRPRLRRALRDEARHHALAGVN